jgi:hypothetical protein
VGPEPPSINAWSAKLSWLELAAGGVDLGGAALHVVGAVQEPLDFFGSGSKDAMKHSRRLVCAASLNA